MILVKSVEIEYVEGKQIQLALMPTFNSPWQNDEPSETHHSTEVVEAEVFINSRREQVIVGISKEAQRALGIPMETIQDMHNTIEQLNHKITRYQHDFIRITREHQFVVSDLELAKNRKQLVESAGLWKRIKFLFTGVRV